ncbi:MAG: hypothetical protein WC325_12690 [Candidatus Bathyarchaeia archaeon]|jgi:hypothetical protein
METKWLTPIPEIKILSKDPIIMVPLNDIEFQDQDGSVNLSKRGLCNDGASIPSFLDIIWDPLSLKMIRSVIQHDEDYVKHDLDPTFKQKRHQVDRRFVRSLRCEKFGSATLWFTFTRIFGQKLWDEPSHSVDDQNWFAAMKAGEEALDEWIRKILDNPQVLERVKYCKSISRDNIRRNRSLLNDFNNFCYWLSHQST